LCTTHSGKYEHTGKARTCCQIYIIRIMILSMTYNVFGGT